MLLCHFRASSLWTDERRGHFMDWGRGKLKGSGTATSSLKTRKISPGQSNSFPHRNSIHAVEATPLPNREDLPTWAAALIDDPSLVSIPHLQAVVANVAQIERYSVSHHRTTVRRFYRCTLAVRVGADTYCLKVKAAMAQQARETAWLHMLAKLHARGWKLDYPKGQKNPSLAPKGSLAARGHYSIKNLWDVYHYCATTGTLPGIQLRKDTNTGLFEYTIVLDEQFIHVSGTHKAQANACKNAIDAFQAAVNQDAVQGGLSDEVPVIYCRLKSQKDAADFMSWLIRHGLIKVDVHNTARTSVEGAETPAELAGFIVEYQLLSLKSRTVWRSFRTPEVWGSTTAEGHEVAIFHAALKVARQRPKLLRRYAATKVSGKDTLGDSQAGTKNALAEDANSMGASERDITFQSASSTRLNISHILYTLMESVPNVANYSDSGLPAPDDRSQKRPRWFRLMGPAKARHSSSLADAFASYETDVSLAIREARRALPMMSYKRKLMEMVDNNVYSVLIGATGSGKTTQVPQLIFEDWCRRGRGADCNIICTQPRVMAAISVANRVGDELGQQLKGRVGYHVRDHARIPRPRDGGIIYCTTGILLQQLQHGTDRILNNVSHLILDEVHERRMELDFTLTWLKHAIAVRLNRGLRVPRILLMSATLNEKVFVNHLMNFDSSGKLKPTPSLSVPGRAYPVSEKYLEEVLSDIQGAHGCLALENLRTKLEYKPSLKYIENELSPTTGDFQPVRTTGSEQDVDWDTSDELTTPLGLIAETIAHVISTTNEGATLVFLPGLGEINKVEDILKSSELPIFGVNFNLEHKYKFFKLHSTLPDSQQTVFQPVPPGVRKIILSSPIAETSVTIPDVTFVIDSGQVRELQYDQTIGASWLRNGWIDGSRAKQRAGRAGRVQEGTYLALYSKARREAMPASGVPELVRADLQSVCLAIKSKKPGFAGVARFLEAAIDAPPDASVKDAIQSLIVAGALTPQQDITSLGQLLSDIPIHPSLAKMIVIALIFKCLDPIIIVGVAIKERDMWVGTPELRNQVLKSKLNFAEHSGSDLIATYNAFCYMRQNSMPADEAARQKHLQLDVFDRIKTAAEGIRDTLVSNGLLQEQDAGDTDQRIGGDAVNVNSNNQNVVKAVLVAGLQANLGCAKLPGMKRTFALGHRPDATPSQFSVLSTFEAKAHDTIRLIAFGQLAVVNDSYIMRHVTAISPITAALFGSSLSKPSKHAAPVVNKFMPLRISVWEDEQTDELSEEKIWQVLERFRKTLDQVLSIAFDNMARTRRGDSATSAEPASVVAKFVDQVVQILDTEAHAEKLHHQKAAMARKEEEKATLEKMGQKRAQSARGVARGVILGPMKMLPTRRHNKATSNILTDLGTGSEENGSKWPESRRRFIFGMFSMDGFLQKTSDFASQMWKTALKAPTSQSESQDGTGVKLGDKRGNIQSKHSPRQRQPLRPSKPKRLWKHNSKQSSKHHEQQ